MLPNLKVASPCLSDWSRMKGDDRVRYCPACNLNVYDFSALTAREVKQLITNREGRLCARLYRRADGTILTKDCPVGFRARVRKVSRIAGAALSAVMSVGPAAAQTAEGSTSLVQVDRKGAELDVTVVDASGAVIQNANVSIIDRGKRQVGEGRTDTRGLFRYPGLAAGRYDVQVKATNFTTALRQDLVVLREGATHMQIPLQVSMDVGVMGGVVTIGEAELTPIQLPGADALPLRPVPSQAQTRSWVSRLFHRGEKPK